MSVYIKTIGNGGLDWSYGICVTTLGTVYASRALYHSIYKVEEQTVNSLPQIKLTLLAGSGSYGISGSADGTGNAARFSSPMDICVDSSGNVYVTDLNNHTIRKVTSAGVTTTLAGQATTAGYLDATGTAAKFKEPRNVAVDTAGSVYVSDTGNCVIRKVTSAGVVSTLAGSAGLTGTTNGTGSAARFSSALRGLDVDASGNLYVCDLGNGLIRKITSAGVVTTFCQTDGYDLALDSSGNLWICDSSTIKKVTTAGAITTEAGVSNSSGSNDGLGSAARLYFPNSIAVTTAGILWISDYGNGAIRYSVSSLPATVTLSNLSFTYDGTAKIPSTTVSPSGLAVQLTYAGTAASLSAPVSAGSYAVTASVVDDFYYGTTTGVVTISKASQTITFASIPNKFGGSGAFQVFPAASSNLSVSLSSSNTSVATVSGSYLTPITAGTTTISATQAGDTNYNAAITVTQVLTVVNSPIAQTIDFPQLSPRRVANAGDIYQQAVQLASTTSLSFADATAVAQGNARTQGSFQLVATASSGLPVTFQSTVTDVALVVGSTCIPVTAGVTEIVATQDGNTAYASATAVTRTLVVVEKQFAWLDTRWDLTDLQVNLVTREVTTSRKNGSILSVRQGDDCSLAVFFTDKAGAALAINPAQIKVTIREKTNRQPVILETSSFSAADFGGLDPYYLISFRADNDSLQRFVAFNGVTDNSDAIPAIGQIEWIYNGKVYSSKPFAVSIVPEIEREISDV